MLTTYRPPVIPQDAFAHLLALADLVRNVDKYNARLTELKSFQDEIATNEKALDEKTAAHDAAVKQANISAAALNRAIENSKAAIVKGHADLDAAIAAHDAQVKADNEALATAKIQAQQRQESAQAALDAERKKLDDENTALQKANDDAYADISRKRSDAIAAGEAWKKRMALLDQREAQLNDRASLLDAREEALTKNEEDYKGRMERLSTFLKQE